MTKIQWTEATWNPVVGCSPVSEGCRNCYAAKHAIRLGANPQTRHAYEGTAEMRGLGERRRAVFTGRVNLVPERLGEPLRWKKPRRVFVNSMSDLFHKDVPFEFIAEVFAVMALASEHTFQILTKRPGRMASLLGSDDFWRDVELHVADRRVAPLMTLRSPLPNVWLGTSVEDQWAADKRIPHLLEIPAAVRFLSCEPLLGPVDLSSWIGNPPVCGTGSERAWLPDDAGVDWVIVGGESGPGARPCDVAWIRKVVEQCRAADVPVFVKQLGANIHDRNDAGFDAESHVWAEGPDAGKPVNRRAWPTPADVEHDVNGYREEYQGAPVRVHLRDRKGGNPDEWPEDLRVREYPAA